MEKKREKLEYNLNRGTPRSCIIGMTEDDQYDFLVNNLARFVAAGSLEDIFLYSHGSLPYARAAEDMRIIIGLLDRVKISNVNDFKPPSPSKTYKLFRGIAATPDKAMDVVLRTSWTDSIEIAEEFSRRHGMWIGNPSIWSLTVPAQHIIAYSSLRAEAEYIVDIWSCKGKPKKVTEAERLKLTAKGNGRCFSCDKPLDKKTQVECPICHKTVCDKCMMECNICGAVGCQKCVVYCDYCVETVCPNCRETTPVDGGFATTLCKWCVEGSEE